MLVDEALHSIWLYVWVTCSQARTVKVFHITTFNNALYCVVHMDVLFCHLKAFYKTIFIEFQYF